MCVALTAINLPVGPSSRGNLLQGKVHLLSCASAWLSCSPASVFLFSFFFKPAVESPHNTNFVSLRSSSLLLAAQKVTLVRTRAAVTSLRPCRRWARERKQTSSTSQPWSPDFNESWLACRNVRVVALTWASASSERDTSSLTAVCVGGGGG